MPLLAAFTLGLCLGIIGTALLVSQAWAHSLDDAAARSRYHELEIELRARDEATSILQRLEQRVRR